MSDRFHGLRVVYDAGQLLEAQAGTDPLALFERWLAEAIAAGLPEPNAMTLATATPGGRPSARIVLLKGAGPEGFDFYSNYESRKATEIAANPFAALTFHWQPLHRQVRVEGPVARVAEAESEAYFASRPRGSQLGAWASSQSRPLDGREALEARLAALEREHPADRPVPRPPHWGGYRLHPERLEFWQGRPSRLHDRLLYERSGEGWARRRLAP